MRAFVDVQDPGADAALAAIEGPVVVLPLLLSSGFHVFHDLHGIVAGRPDAVVADPLGPDARLAEVLAGRLPMGDEIVLAVAGSRDDRSATDADGMAQLLAARLGRPVRIGYLAAREPELGALLAQHPDAVVSTYLLARGYFFDLAVKRADGRPISAPLLDGDEVPAELVELVLDRFRTAAAHLHHARG